MSIRYYSTQRPVMPGSFPRPDGNKVLEIVNFDERTPCPDIGRDAWGYIEYEKPLDEVTVRRYELQGNDGAGASKDDLIQKALNDYEEMARSGKIHGFTPSEVNSLWFIMKDLYEGDFSETLSGKVACWFSKHGFTVKRENVGWRIQ